MIRIRKMSESLGKVVAIKCKKADEWFAPESQFGAYGFLA